MSIDHPSSYPNVPETMQGVPGRPQPQPKQVQPLGIAPLEIVAQQVAEQWRQPLRRTVGLPQQLSYLRAAFLAGYRYAMNPTTHPATFGVVAADRTWTPYEDGAEPRYWNRNTMQSEP